MRCPRCGNENQAQNRFCGMCGATLLAPPASHQPVPVSTPNATTVELTAARSEPVKPARVEPPPDNRPAAISGPSFLGLNDPSPSSRGKRARLSIDPHSAPGSNLDYLLDEEEEQPSHWGPGKILLVMIALALALGFGYLRWKTHGFAWLNPVAKKPDAAATQNAPTSDNNPAQPSTAPEPEAQKPVPAAQPTPDTTASNNPSANPPANSTPSTSPAPESNTKPSDAGSSNATTPADDKDSATPKEPEAEAPPKAVEKPKPVAKPAPKPATPKPSPARPVVASDPVAEAQRYLYGKGVAQDCDRGMRLLKPAANQANTKAMVEMGALYSAGLCTPHDLPTAYRWFAMALRKDPDNTAVQSDLSKLWKEMTPPEQQLAIKLTQ